jgi:hypothetical protein
LKLPTALNKFVDVLLSQYLKQEIMKDSVMKGNVTPQHDALVVQELSTSPGPYPGSCGNG